MEVRRGEAIFHPAVYHFRNQCVGNAVPSVPIAARRQFGICSENLPIEVKFSDGTPSPAFPTMGFYRFKPVDSSMPSMMFMFWMAAPEAPLPRLSKRAVTMVWFSWPVTMMRMVSLFARVEA